MAYRKIVVDGKQYEFVVGKSHTKVRSVDDRSFNVVVPNSHVGQPAVGWPCQYYVRQPNIADFIRAGGVGQHRTLYVCKKHNAKTDEVTYDPYERERFITLVRLW